jgi:hypothetical protein
MLIYPQWHDGSAEVLSYVDRAMICRIVISACIARRFQFRARLTMSDSVP